MKPSEIIALARRQTGCTEDIVTIDEAYHFLNFIIEDFGAEIRTSDSGFGFDTLDINVTAGQGSYTFEGDEEIGTYSNKFPISKIQSVRLLDQTTGKRQDLPVHFVDKVDLNKFQSNEKPRACFITRTEINIIPLPKEDSIMQVRGFNYNQLLQPDLWIIKADNNVEYTRDANKDVVGANHPYGWTNGGSTVYSNSPKSITSDSVRPSYNSTSGSHSIISYRVETFDDEANIWIPRRWHYVIVEGMKYWMYGNMGVNFETARANSRAFYDSEKNKAIQNIMDRGQLSDTAYFPNLNYLNY